MTICFEPQRSHRSLSLIFTKGKVSPRCARSFDSDNRAECLHLRQYAPVVAPAACELLVYNSYSGRQPGALNKV